MRIRVSSGESRFLLKSEQHENRDEDDEVRDEEDGDEGTVVGEWARAGAGLPGPEHAGQSMQSGPQ